MNVDNTILKAKEIAEKVSLDQNICSNAIHYLSNIDESDIKVIFSELKNNIKKHTIHERSLMLGNLEEIRNIYMINDQILRNLSQCTLDSNGEELKNILKEQQVFIKFIINTELDNKDYNDTMKLQVTSNYYHYILYIFYLILVILALIYCLFYNENIYFVDMFIFIVGLIILLHYGISYIKNHIKIKLYY